MCGIIGYIGVNKVIKDTLIKGLKLLEYRGYDSAGIYFRTNKEYKLFKSVGKIKNLEQLSSFDELSNLGIGHTRWATHGEVNEKNTHPHISNNKNIVLVHNGVINNYLELKEDLINKGYTFYSDTDSEVIVNLIELLYTNTNDMLGVLNNLFSYLKGSFSLAIINKKENNKLYFVTHETPLLVCKTKDSMMLVSDVNAGSAFSNEFVSLNDLDYGYITNDDVYIYKNGIKQECKSFKVNISDNELSLGGFPHYMIKEIYETPMILNKICKAYIDENYQLVNINNEIINNLKNANKIYIVGCGTSYHAGLIGKYVFEKELKKSVEVVIASEFDEENTYIIPDSYFIFISQSGETYDVKNALAKIKGKFHTLLLTNVISSSLGRECEDVINILAGPEIAVASTKAYSAEVAILILLAYSCNMQLDKYKEEIANVILSIEETLIRSHHLLSLVKDNLVDKEHCFFIGKQLDYYISLEASLKLKEISYIHSEAFAGGELKHGTIALIEKNVPVIGIVSDKKYADALRSNLEEVRSRKAIVIAISSFEVSKDSDDFVVREVSSNMKSLALVPVFQLIAYYAALLRYKDIDKPRNLAKSVTVE